MQRGTGTRSDAGAAEPPTADGDAASKTGMTLLPHLLAAVAGSCLAAGTPAHAEAPPRVRGVIESIASDTVTIRRQAGPPVTLETGADTTYAEVVPWRLEMIKVDDYVGVAVKKHAGALVAMEVVLVPKSEQAGRIAYYPWDPLPDPTAGAGARVVATDMTNGVVSKVAASARLAPTDMANGVVSADAERPGGRTLTVVLESRKSIEMFVPAGAPVTRFVAADRSVMRVGSPVFIKTNPGGRSGFVAVGKGVTPPM